MTVKDVLESIGYKVQPFNNYWRMSALYRKSNSLSLSVHKETGWFQDFVTGQNGPLQNLVALTLGIGKEEALKKLKVWGEGFSIKNSEKETLKQEESFDKSFIDDLLPSYAFYRNRGISESTLKRFGGGVKTSGKLNNRFVFPIYDENSQLVGIAGRDLFEKSERPKWKIIGRGTNFIYPFHITGQEIEKTGQVVLVESIGDGLALYEAGIKNFLVLFGTNISKKVILYLIRQNVQSIIIATNNDEKAVKNWGMDAASKIHKTLLKYFDGSKIEIRLPLKNDFGEMSKEEIRLWAGEKSAKLV